MEALDQGSAAGIVVGIEGAMRLPAPGQESLQPQHVAIVGWSDNDRTACTAFQQADTAQDQRPHDALTEVSLLHHQVAQPLRGDHQRLNRLNCLGIHKRRAGGKLGQFASKVARTVDDDSLAPVEPAVVRNFHLA